MYNYVTVWRIWKPFSQRCAFTSLIGTSLLWKIPAASTASGFAFWRHSEKCCTHPAPEDAMTGMDTALTISVINSTSLTVVDIRQLDVCSMKRIKDFFSLFRVIFYFYSICKCLEFLVLSRYVTWWTLSNRQGWV